MCKWNNLYNLWHNSAWEFVLEITQNVKSTNKKLISNKMRICRYLTRCTRLGREIYTDICEESSVSNISEEYTAFRERWNCNPSK